MSLSYHSVIWASKRVTRSRSNVARLRMRVEAEVAHERVGVAALLQERRNAVDDPRKVQEPPPTARIACGPRSPPPVATVREIGFEDVDCLKNWRELDLLRGLKPTA